MITDSTLAVIIATTSPDLTFLLELIDETSTAVRLSHCGIDLVSDGETFEAGVGFHIGQITLSDDGRPAITDIAVPVVSGSPITPARVRAGVWRKATAKMWLAAQSDPDARHLVFDGFVGPVHYSDSIGGMLELVTLAERNNDLILDTVGPQCSQPVGGRALGLGKCGVNLSPFTVSGTVDTSLAPTRTLFKISVTNPSGFDFTAGGIWFTSGDNNNIYRPVRSWDSVASTVSLLQPAPFVPANGDTIRVHRGCKHTYDECNVFDGYAFNPGYAFAPGEEYGKS